MTTDPREPAPPGTAPPSPCRPALSFELYPPRSSASEDALLHTLDQLAAAAPDYVSVTAAAEGHRRRRSLDLLAHLVQHTSFRPLAHVLATGQSRTELQNLLEEIVELGVRGLLALRGDRPEGHEPGEEELPFARHLVELIREVEHQQRARLGAGGLAVGVAAYPVRHPESSSIHQDIEVLLAKQRAGADFAITQVYTDPAQYRDLLERARQNHVDLPLVPGILPVTSLQRYTRICSLAGIQPDPALAHALETARTDAERREAGVAAAHHQARAALEDGAPGLHLYTFNEHPAALELLDRLDLPRPALSRRTPLKSTPITLFSPRSGYRPSGNQPLDDTQETIVTHQQNTASAQSTASPQTPFPEATVLGYPRIGRRRELKKALEQAWAGNSSAEELAEAATGVRRSTIGRLQDLGLDQPSAVPASFALYDQVLDTLVAVSALPRRFGDLADAQGRISREASFVLARGDDARGPLEMTKWFDTNYHYLVPEIGPETDFAAHPEEILGQAALGQEGSPLRPVLVGPVTFLLLAKAEDGSPEGFDPLSRLADLVPVYQQLITALGEQGAPWVQLDEPALVADQDREDLPALVQQAYSALAVGRTAQDPSLFVTTPYGDAEELLPVLAATGVEAVHTDLASGRRGLRGLTAEQLAPFTAPGAPVLVAGVVDGRNIWRADLDAALSRLQDLREAGAHVAVSTSTSLQHVPHDLQEEASLPEEPRRWLAFADQKAEEVLVLARGLAQGPETVAAELEQSRQALASRRASESTRNQQVRARTQALTEADARREPAEQRRAAQAVLGLPPLPTTTIGSFPQTPGIRQDRAAHRTGRISDAEYEARLREEIAQVIRLQEDLGLDVLVHGEAERNDMVQYFAENFDGFDTTEHGWVQSYGSRCTRPSILWGDVSRSGQGVRGEAFTVPWTAYAQSLTPRPVKGMLTGPVTILAWSFVREDQPLGETADQVALALRDEIEDLEAEGVGIIQVDEPALRELLPLRRRDHQQYLDWSVRSFRHATSSVRPETQIHTHLCYSEFGEVLSAIDALDADVTSVEAARSRMELLDPLEESGFDRGIGPGVWDIHSPRVPTVEEIQALLTEASAVVPADRLWSNPDCGLKTRAYPETKAALAHLVEATARVRARLQEDTESVRAGAAATAEA